MSRGLTPGWGWVGRESLLRSAQILPQGLVQPPIKKAVERLWSPARLGVLQGGNIGRAIFGPHSNGWITTPDQDQIHQQPRSAPIAVVERMDLHQTAMRVERILRR